MTGVNRIPLLRRCADSLLIILFLLFLWLPTADSFFHLNHGKPLDEKRTLAAFPTFVPTAQGAQNYLSGLEGYFKDHFGFRSKFVRLEQRWKRKYFDVSPVKHVMVGKNGWLFYSGGVMMDDIAGNRPFNQSQLEAWRAHLTARRDWLAKRGIRYLFVVAPDKHTIYPEYLPDWQTRTARPPQRIDQFITYLRTHSDLPILDLRPDLIAAKKNGIVYLATDTHWNSMGGYIAYKRIIETLDSLGLPGKPLDISAFAIIKDTHPAGDLARMLGLEKSMPEPNSLNFTPKPPLSAVEIRIDNELLEKKWRKDTNPRMSENSAQSGKVVVFHDSFAGFIMPFLGQNFNRVVYIWQQNWNKDLIEREKPELVIDQMLERFIVYRDPAQLAEADEQPEVQVFGDE